MHAKVACWKLLSCVYMYSLRSIKMSDDLVLTHRDLLWIGRRSWFSVYVITFYSSFLSCTRRSCAHFWSTEVAVFSQLQNSMEMRKTRIWRRKKSGCSLPSDLTRCYLLFFPLCVTSFFPWAMLYTGTIRLIATWISMWTRWWEASTSLVVPVQISVFPSRVLNRPN
jgi:hypothetical protein